MEGVEDALKAFLAERDAVLRSLDKAKLLAYYRRSGEGAIADQWERAADDRNFWAAVHRARLTLVTFTEAEKEVSRRWLSEHGFEPRGL